ncbi:MAG: Lrp/AsnC family transcriptional regulator [Firmicutes bacterium]|nr:Lrp/AsnC family transcriptional regulator [Bacillota bacterium]
MELDELDKEIIAILREDGKTPYTTVAAKVGVAEATVRKRVNRLLDAGVLRITAAVNPEKIGLTTQAIVGVKVEGKDVETIIERLSAMDNVRYIGVCTGDYDLMLHVAMPSSEELFHFLTRTLREIPGVGQSQTSLIMKVFKEAW